MGLVSLASVAFAFPLIHSVTAELPQGLFETDAKTALGNDPVFKGYITKNKGFFKVLDHSDYASDKAAFVKSEKVLNMFATIVSALNKDKANLLTSSDEIKIMVDTYDAVMKPEFKDTRAIVEKRIKAGTPGLDANHVAAAVDAVATTMTIRPRFTRIYKKMQKQRLTAVDDLSNVRTMATKKCIADALKHCLDNTDNLKIMTDFAQKKVNELKSEVVMNIKEVYLKKNKKNGDDAWTPKDLETKAIDQWVEDMFKKQSHICAKGAQNPVPIETKKPDEKKAADNSKKSDGKKSDGKKDAKKAADKNKKSDGKKSDGKKDAKKDEGVFLG